MKNCWSFRLSSSLHAAVFCFCAQAQYSGEEKRVPVSPAPYLFPINPGQPNMLTGTMGELRNTHFHGGIDINTPGIGVPVRAAQDGYVRRVTISPFGYGNVVYVQHPDGLTSVYAHLHELRGPLAAYVREQHYARKSNNLDLFLAEGRFQVQRGDTLALSGNTGSSGGPHLHFEIRTAHDELINPLTFGFKEIADPIAPVIQKIALRTLTIDSRINDQFGRFEFYPVKTSTGYTLPPILAHGKIGVEVLAYDKLDRSRFKCGINYIDLFENDEKVFSQHIEMFSLAETRGILTLLDYRQLTARGLRFNKLYIADGNRMEFYQNSRHQGIIEVSDREKQIRLVLRDQMSNQSTLRFTLRPAPVTATPALLTAPPPGLTYETDNHVLQITSQPCPDETLTLYANGAALPQTPAYGNARRSVYLINLSETLPDSAVYCRGTARFQFADKIPAGVPYRFYSTWLDVEFPAQALYQPLFLETSRRQKDSMEFFSVGNRYSPLHKSVRISIRPEKNYPESKQWGMYRVEGNRLTATDSEWRDGRVIFTTREWGVFTLRQDTVPPTVTPLKSAGPARRFKIKDNLAGIAYYEANLNGAWLLLTYDYKTGLLETDRGRRDLKGVLELKVVDHAGNETIIKQNLP
jgi:hypothetical protein